MERLWPPPARSREPVILIFDHRRATTPASHVEVILSHHRHEARVRTLQGGANRSQAYISRAVENFSFASKLLDDIDKRGPLTFSN
jgi:hypothetical protein